MLGSAVLMLTSVRPVTIRIATTLLDAQPLAERLLMPLLVARPLAPSKSYHSERETALRHHSAARFSAKWRIANTAACDAADWARAIHISVAGDLEAK
jgi:hypothetical protein